VTEVTDATAVQPSRIAGTFEALREASRTGILPFVTAGFPHMNITEEIVVAMANAGANGFEIGVPYSDPMADGPTVQHSSQVALRNGTKVGDCIDLVRRLRERGVTVPLVLMGYYNPIVRYGVERFVADATAAGTDGFIVPDLPAVESDPLHSACRKYGRDLVYMVAPTITDELIDQVAKRASGFIYCVSVKGVTGARDKMSTTLPEYLDRVRAKTDVPLVVGFGISRPEHVNEVGQHSDGVIVASALLDYLEGYPEEEHPDRAVRYLRYMRGEVDL
jgi:tryptophan synthase alpha chain